MISVLDFIRGFILPHENAYQSGHYGDPNFVVAEHVEGDPGGTTKYGIDQASHPTMDIENLTQDQAEQTYLEEYNAVRWALTDDTYPALAEFPPPANLAFFDCREVCGARAAWLCVQRALGLSDDGIPGQNTRLTVMQSPGLTLAMSSIDQRIAYHRGLVAVNPALGKFLDGWISRCNDLKTYLSPPGGS